MKCYIITRRKDGTLQLLAQAIVKGQLVEQTFSGSLDIGNASIGTKNLSRQILSHYYGADPAAQAEAQRQTQKFMDGFLLSHQMPAGAKYEISDSVIDTFFSLNQPA